MNADDPVRIPDGIFVEPVTISLNQSAAVIEMVFAEAPVAVFDEVGIEFHSGESDFGVPSGHIVKHCACPGAKINQVMSRLHPLFFVKKIAEKDRASFGSVELTDGVIPVLLSEFIECGARQRRHPRDPFESKQLFRETQRSAIRLAGQSRSFLQQIKFRQFV
jgi:hypothetical protein